MKHSNEVKKQGDISLLELESAGNAHAESYFYKSAVYSKSNSLFIQQVEPFCTEGITVSAKLDIDVVFAEFSLFTDCVACRSNK